MSTLPEAAAPLVTSARIGRVAWLTLNNPRALNALSMPMLQALDEAFAEAAHDKAVKVVVIAAEGKGFCAGHDLKEMTRHRQDPDGGRAFYEALFEQCTKVMLAITRAPVPVIAVVHGIATAAGCQLVSACDIVIASTEARFGVNGVDAGLFCSTPLVALSRAIPAKAAMEMLVLGEIIPAERAEMLGLVNRIVEPDALNETALAYAERAARKSRAVVALGKSAFYAQRDMDLDAAYAHTCKVIVDNLMMDEAREGIGAFIEKRAPVWPDDAE
ncbi:MAG: enoyl-CoA hydratase [Rhodobiaceae bacterium]|nr:enoyl-CoA hydratase [Rhodobiaceae bacterium]